MSKLKTPTDVAGWNRFHQRANSSSCSRAQASNTSSSQQRDQPGPGPGCCWVERPQRSTGALRHAVAPGLVVKYQLQQQLLTTLTNNNVEVAFLKQIRLILLTFIMYKIIRRKINMGSCDI